MAQIILWFLESAGIHHAMDADLDDTWITTSTPEKLVSAGCMASRQSSGDARPVRQEAIQFLMWMKREIQEHVVSMAEIPEEEVHHAPAIILEILHVFPLTTPLNPGA